MIEEFYGRDLAKYKLERAKVRHASDYDEFYIASREEAEKQIQTAKILIEAVNEFI